MASLTIDVDGFGDQLEKLADDMRRRTAKRMLTAGAEVLTEADKAEIIRGRHVRTGEMLESVRMTEIREGLDGAYTYVYAQGEDSRGVRNEMKNQIINQGYWRKKGRRNVRKDAYVARVQRDAEEKVRQAMEAAYEAETEASGLT